MIATIGLEVEATLGMATTILTITKAQTKVLRETTDAQVTTEMPKITLEAIEIMTIETILLQPETMAVEEQNLSKGASRTCTGDVRSQVISMAHIKLIL